MREYEYIVALPMVFADDIWSARPASCAACRWMRCCAGLIHP
jgi:hypothetical protein